MRVLFVHNYYQRMGGEDVSVDAEADLLESRGHDVLRYSRHSNELNGTPHWKIGLNAVWNRGAKSEIRDLLRSERPDIVHCTNTFPLISPSVYSAAEEASVPVVQALRNYRTICANACLFRDGGPCETCVSKKLAWPGITNACYRSSRIASVAFVAQQAAQRRAARHVDRYYALTEFARRKYVLGGLSANRIDVKPNFVDPDPGMGSHDGGYALFAGRLSPEKGISLLLDAWSKTDGRTQLKIAGDGTERPLVLAAKRSGINCTWAGQCSHAEVLQMAGAASFVINSSTVYETFGRTVIEAFSRGTPVLVPRVGAPAELVEDGVTGLCFEPGDPADLARCAAQLIESPSLCRRLGDQARREYENHYTAEANYQQLMAIYRRAMAEGAEQ